MAGGSSFIIDRQGGAHETSATMAEFNFNLNDITKLFTDKGLDLPESDVDMVLEADRAYAEGGGRGGGEWRKLFIVKRDHPDPDGTPPRRMWFCHMFLLEPYAHVARDFSHGPRLLTPRWLARAHSLGPYDRSRVHRGRQTTLTTPRGSDWRGLSRTPRGPETRLGRQTSCTMGRTSGGRR